MGDRDVDAEFADIIARWDEVESLPDPVGPEGTATGTSGAATHSAAFETLDERTDTDDRAVPPGRSVTNPSPLRPSPTNPPPTRPFVVWRGAEQAPADED